MTRNIFPILLTAGIFLAGVALARTPDANPKVLLKTTMGDITIDEVREVCNWIADEIK